MNAPVDLDAVLARQAPRSTGKVAEPIDRHRDRLVPGRQVVRRREVRDVMLHPLDGAAETLPGERGTEDVLEALPLEARFDLPQDVRQAGPLLQEVNDAFAAARLRIAVDCDDAHVGQAGAGFL